MSAVEFERVDGVRVARHRGDIDAANALIVDEALVKSLEPEGDCLVFDLGETRYLDSAALDMLFRLHDRLRQRRGNLHLVIPPDSPLKRLAAIVGLPNVVPVHETLTEAVAVCAKYLQEHREDDPAAPGTTADDPQGLSGRTS